jgi:protein-tyrosine phosphatase
LPVLFNCSAGKDRTGIAAALLLDLLGVDRDVILDDYRLTEQAFNFRALVDNHSGDHALSEDVVDALIAAHPDYLNACFEQITNQHGDVAGYFDEVLGINLDVQETYPSATAVAGLIQALTGNPGTPLPHPREQTCRGI